MKAQKWGRIVNTASAHSLVASPFKSAYVAAKHGLPGLTKTVALELATFGVTANCISPGLCLDAAGREPDSRHDEGAQHDARAGDQRRAAGRPADQAIRHRPIRSPRCAVYLCSDAAAADHRRQLLDRRRLDGGVSAAGESRRAGRGQDASAQDRQSRAAGRRLARRLHLGRRSTGCSRTAGSKSAPSAAPAPGR